MERTAYMQWLMTSVSGLPERMWERLIVDQLMIECRDKNPQAFDILKATGDKAYTHETFLKAAKIVIESSSYK